MKIILLIMIGLSLVHAEFTRSSDVVSDSVTKLQWQDDAIGSSMSWSSAIEYCENLTLAGYSDWRLPNINELKSIVDRSKYDPAIVDIFENRSSSSYWSSTTNGSSKNDAWVVYFYSGLVGISYKDYSYYVRCVREGQ